MFSLIVGLPALYAQDIIYKTDGTEIKAKVSEITTETIKYKNYNQLEGPIRNILLSDVFMVVYEDGTREVIQENKEAPKPSQSNITNETINAYATINLYRPYMCSGNWVQYPVNTFINGNLISVLPPKFKLRYKVYKEGVYEVYIISKGSGKKQPKHPQETLKTINVSFGKNYYLKICSNQTFEKQIQLMEESIGLQEFNKIKDNKLTKIEGERPSVKQK